MRLRRGALATAAVLAGLAASAAGCGATVTSEVPLTSGGGVWAPNSRSIARVVGSGIEIAKPNGKRIRLIHSATPSRGLGWSEDGKTLLFLSKEPHQKPDRTERVSSAPVDDGPISWAPLGTHAGGIGWSPSGWPLAFTTAYLYYDVFRGPVGPRPALWTMAGLRHRPRRILDLPGEEREPRFSPDGRMILFSLERKKGRTGLWLVQRDGSKPRRLLAGVGGDAAWSPDGRWIALTATVAGGDLRQHLYVVPATGGALRQLGPEEVRSGEAPAWTPDGHWITYATYEGEVRRVHPDGSGAETIANFPHREVRNLAWSPDGSHLAYTAEPIVEGD